MIIKGMEAHHVCYIIFVNNIMANSVMKVFVKKVILKIFFNIKHNIASTDQLTLKYVLLSGPVETF